MLLHLTQVKVALWGEDRAHLPPSSREEMRVLSTEFIQVVPGSRDREGRQVSTVLKMVACLPALTLDMLHKTVQNPTQSMHDD